MMHGDEKSDPSIVAGKPANGIGRPGPERVERRKGTEENTGQASTRRTPRRVSVSLGLDRVRTAARLNGKERFTALLHHVDVGLLHRTLDDLVLQCCDAERALPAVRFWDVMPA